MSVNLTVEPTGAFTVTKPLSAVSAVQILWPFSTTFTGIPAIGEFSGIKTVRKVTASFSADASGATSGFSSASAIIVSIVGSPEASAYTTSCTFSALTARATATMGTNAKSLNNLVWFDFLCNIILIRFLRVL